jgi:hypothetical protein
MSSRKRRECLSLLRVTVVGKQGHNRETIKGVQLGVTKPLPLGQMDEIKEKNNLKYWMHLSTSSCERRTPG